MKSTSKNKIDVNLSKILKDSKVYDPESESQVVLKNYWEGNRKPLVMIHWMRRFG